MTPGRRNDPKALALALIAVFFGWLGVDRFVNGNVLAGVLKLLTLGGLGVWWIIDIVIFTYRAHVAWAESGPRVAEAAPRRQERSAARARGTGVLPQTSRREYTPSAPRGFAIRPWVESSRTTEVAGEFFLQDTYEKLFQGLPKNGIWHNLDLDADLYPDPLNPYATSGHAISVWVKGHHAGYLADDNAARYSPMLRDLAENHSQYLRVTARVSGYYQGARRKWHADTRLGLPEPRDVLPRNQLPEGDLELIPTGRVIQATGEENHMDYLGQIVDPSGPSHYVATLRPTQMGGRTFYDTVQVLLDGNEVGTFSRAMGEQTAPLVKLIEAAGKTAVARATIEGNALRVEVKVRMQRAAEFDHDRVRALQELARERKANTNHRGEAFEWDDDDLTAKRGRTRGHETREQQDRNEGKGGA